MSPLPMETPTTRWWWSDHPFSGTGSHFFFSVRGSCAFFSSSGCIRRSIAAYRNTLHAVCCASTKSFPAFTVPEFSRPVQTAHAAQVHEDQDPCDHGQRECETCQKTPHKICLPLVLSILKHNISQGEKICRPYPEPGFTGAVSYGTSVGSLASAKRRIVRISGQPALTEQVVQP